jgi:fructoselysine 6-kinase
MRLLGAGDNVVDRYVDLDVMYPGGNAVNVAVFARRAGADAAYQGVVGTDVAGRLVLDALSREGVDVSRVRVSEGPNAFANVRVSKGERIFLDSDDGVSAVELTASELIELGSFDVVHTATAGSLYHQVADMADWTKVSFDFSRKRDREYVGAIAEHLWLGTFSTSGLSTEEAEELLRFTCACGTRFALASRGAQGALLFDGATLWRGGATPVDVVDTLGAGDAYIASLLVGLLEGDPIREAMDAAASRGAEVCAIHGAFGYPMPLAPVETDGDRKGSDHRVPTGEGSSSLVGGGGRQ